jgi:hypothetical protein
VVAVSFPMLHPLMIEMGADKALWLLRS